MNTPTQLPAETYKPTDSAKKSDFPIGKAIFYLGGLAGVIYVGKMLYDNAQQSSESGKLAESIETQQATMINSILKNSVLSFIYVPQADADRLIQLAKQIKNWDAVQASFKTLYGENLTDLLSHKLTSDNWQKFLANLAVKGQPQNASGSTVVTPNVPSAGSITVNDSVFLNWAGKSTINFYTNSTDYPQKPTSIAKPASIANTPFGKVIRIDNVSYVGSSVKMALAQVRLASGTQLWLRVADLSKVRVLGMLGNINQSTHLSLAI